MGRHCGWLALMAGISTGADFIFIPENPPSENWRAEMCSIVRKHREMGKRKTVVVCAEGAHDRNLNKVSANMVKDLLTTEVGLDTRVTTLGHVQRGGAPTSYDRTLATLQGVEAIVRKPMLDAIAKTKEVAAAIERKDFDAAMRGRDAEFEEFLHAFNITTAADKPEMRLPQEKRMRVGIIHVGAPAGGMNAATRAAVAYCLTKGHTPVALYNGFPGMCRHHDDK
ncbi:hypothetical protein D0869_16560, partial [Hortaea werneckii]